MWKWNQFFFRWLFCIFLASSMLELIMFSCNRPTFITYSKEEPFHVRSKFFVTNHPKKKKERRKKISARRQTLKSWRANEFCAQANNSTTIMNQQKRNMSQLWERKNELFPLYHIHIKMPEALEITVYSAVVFFLMSDGFYLISNSISFAARHYYVYFILSSFLFDIFKIREFMGRGSDCVIFSLKWLKSIRMLTLFSISLKWPQWLLFIYFFTKK